MELKLLVATNFQVTVDDLRDQLSQVGIQAELTGVSTFDELESELIKGHHHFIVAEHTLEGNTIWDMAKLVNSSQLSIYALPIYLLINDEDTLPPLLLKDQGIKPITVQAFGDTLKADYEILSGQTNTKTFSFIERPTLLAIEDDEDAAELIRYNLKNDYQVDIAGTGEEGLSIWESKRHDLVLLDYMLPGIQGNEVLEKIMRIDKNQPVIIMTASDKPERSKNLILNGASDYLCKPFSNEAIKERCRTILVRAKLICQLQYTTAKVEKLGGLIWLRDHYLNHNQGHKAETVLKAIKLMVPYPPSDDDQNALLKKEF
jgi:DNA-binding response OmpR family regulator